MPKTYKIKHNNKKYIEAIKKLLKEAGLIEIEPNVFEEKQKKQSAAKKKQTAKEPANKKKTSKKKTVSKTTKKKATTKKNGKD